MDFSVQYSPTMKSVDLECVGDVRELGIVATKNLLMVLLQAHLDAKTYVTPGSCIHCLLM